VGWGRSDATARWGEVPAARGAGTSKRDVLEPPVKAQCGAPPPADDLREVLGLEPGESVRVIQASGRTLVVERSGRVATMALPWDRDLVLTADVRAFALADMLSLIHAAGKSGFLLFSYEDHEKSVYLHRGEVVFAASNQKSDRLGESLLRSGGINLEQLQEADNHWKPSSRFGKVLVELGVLTPRDLWNAVKAQVEEIVRSLFTYTAGSVHFWEGDVQPDNIVRLALPTRRLIAEGLRRRDELFRFLALLEDPRTRLIPSAARNSKLSTSEHAFMDAVAVEGRFSAACQRAGIDPLSGARMLRLLKMVGAIGVEREGGSGDVVGEGDLRVSDEERVRECVYDHAKLMGELAAPLVAMDGFAAVEDRISRVVEEAASRHPELLVGISVRSGGLLDPEDLLVRALRLTGDRLRAVREGLGEIVSYLEFELNNHPRIEDPVHFLEAVGALRAKLEC